MRLLIFFIGFCSLAQAMQWSGFYQKSIDERVQLVCEHAGLAAEHVTLLEQSLPGPALAALSENVVGSYALPFSVAPYFVVNGTNYVVPMVTDEKTVVAAASYGAKLARDAGGFTASVEPPIAVGQIVLTRVPDIDHAIVLINAHTQQLFASAQLLLASMCARGGGLVALQTRRVDTVRGPMLIVELSVNTCDAMGAHLVTRVAEQLAPELAQLTGGIALMGVVSNLVVRRMAYARAVWLRSVLGDECIGRILDAYACACADVARCVTHNKGIMNGIDAVALATGNDFRALEAGAHGYASLGREYQPLTHYYVNGHGDLVGEIELPLAVGTVGGVTCRHPMAQLALQIMHVRSSDELACVMASVGLAQNFAALRALVQEGIAHAFA